MHSPPVLTAAIAGAHPLALAPTDLTARASHLRHFSNFAIAQPLFCAAAVPAGSRYVAPIEPAVLYLAFDADTAYKEFNQHFVRVASIQPGRRLVLAGRHPPAPCVTLGVHIRLSRLLSLAFPFPGWHPTRAALGMN